MIMNVKCDECGKQFKLASLNEKKLSLNGKVCRVSYFCCPYCCKLYVTSIMDSKWLLVSDEINVLKKRIRRATKRHDTKALERLYCTMATKSERLANHEEWLLSEYASCFTLEAGEKGKIKEFTYVPRQRREGGRDV